MEQTVMHILDIFGTVIFAVTGAVQGIKSKLDILGVIVLASTVGVGGGMLRDALIGATPAAALKDSIYIISCIITGLIVFFLPRVFSEQWNVILFGDAVGLGVFTAIGSAKAAALGLAPAGIVLSGVCTAIGGGMIRDILVGRVPVVLKSDFYATASLFGGILYYMLTLWKSGTFFYDFLIVAGLVTGIRLLAIRYKFSLPTQRAEIKE